MVNNSTNIKNKKLITTSHLNSWAQKGIATLWYWQNGSVLEQVLTYGRIRSVESMLKDRDWLNFIINIFVFDIGGIVDHHWLNFIINIFVFDIGGIVDHHWLNFIRGLRHYGIDKMALCWNRCLHMAGLDPLKVCWRIVLITDRFFFLFYYNIV
jgi:hypothetical protein